MATRNWEYYLQRYRVRGNGWELMSGATYLGYATSPALSTALLLRAVRPRVTAAAALSASTHSLLPDSKVGPSLLLKLHGKEMGTEPEIEIGSVPEKGMVGMPENEMGSLQGLQMRD